MRKVISKLEKTLIIIILLLVAPFIISSPNLDLNVRTGDEGSYPKTNEPDPVLFFESTTPPNNTNLLQDWAGINVSISEENLSTFRFGWNEDEYNIYGDNLVLGMNLDENADLGENSTFAHEAQGNTEKVLALMGREVTWIAGRAIVLYPHEERFSFGLKLLRLMRT